MKFSKNNPVGTLIVKLQTKVPFVLDSRTFSSLLVQTSLKVSTSLKKRTPDNLLPPPKMQLLHRPYRT